jgi:phenylacetic acid degradation operon negative regulatory protein
MPGHDDAPEPGNGHARTPRPESLLLAFCGAHLLGRPAAVAVGSVIELTGRLGVGEHAARATLNRMTRRGLLTSTRHGRRAYLSLKPYAESVLRDGGAQLEAEVVNRNWDGRWMLLAFSVPESRRADRHTLRSQLTWAGFGPLQNGLWISPSPGDIAGTLAELKLLDYVRIFRAETVAPSDPQHIVAEAWDLGAIADGYRTFLKRWEPGNLGALDDLSREILLLTEWLLLIRDDPRLPLELLPDNWPGTRAEELFWSLRRELAEPASKLAESTLDWLSL